MNISHLFSTLLVVFGHLLWLVIAEWQPSLDQITTFNAPGPWNFVFAEKDVQDAFEMINEFRQVRFNLNPLKWGSSLVATLTADDTASKEVNIGFAKSVDGNRKAFLYDVLGSIWNATVSECLACEPTKNTCESKPQCNLPYEILSSDAQTIGCTLVLKRKEAQPLEMQPLTGKLACKTNPATSVFRIQLSTKASLTPNNASVTTNDYTGKNRKHHHHHHHNGYPFSKTPVSAFRNDSIHSIDSEKQPANVPLDVKRIENTRSLLNTTTGKSINPLQNQPFNGGAGTPPTTPTKKRDVIQVPLSRDHYEKFLQINPYQGWELVNSINISRAAVSKRRLSLPSSKYMNMLNWSDDLAKQAHQKLKSKSRHHYIDVIDLQFIEMLPDYANRPGELKFKDMAIELDLQNLLMWLVKQYFKKFANGGLRCTKNNCRANCRKGHGTECCAFELIHDQAENIGCAVKFHKEGGPILQADLTCVLSDSMNHGGLIIYKVGDACSDCKTSCDKNLKLCVSERQLQNSKDKYSWQQAPTSV